MMDALGYIAQDNPAAAVNLIIDLQKRVAQVLGTFPEAGVKWYGELRVLTIRRYAFVYQYDTGSEEVMVLDVFGPGMDWR
jgi:plasmid stabilization system protein ParE